MSTLVDDLSQLISAFDENEIEYAVCGELVLMLYELGGYLEIGK